MDLRQAVVLSALSGAMSSLLLGVVASCRSSFDTQYGTWLLAAPGAILGGLLGPTLTQVNSRQMLGFGLGLLSLSLIRRVLIEDLTLKHS